MAGVGALAREVERRERGAETDVVADAGEQLVGGRAVVERAPERFEVVAERVELSAAAEAFSASASRRAAAPMRHCRLRSSRCSTSRRIERLGRRAASARSAPWKPVSLPAASARRRYASAVRVPVRFSTATLTGVQHGTLASPSSSCTGSSTEFTRLSTAMSVGRGAGCRATP